MYKTIAAILLCLSTINTNAKIINNQITITANVLRSCNITNNGSQIINNCNDRKGNFAVHTKDLTKTNYEKGKTIEVGDIKVLKIGKDEYLIKEVTINY